MLSLSFPLRRQNHFVPAAPAPAAPAPAAPFTRVNVTSVETPKPPIVVIEQKGKTVDHSKIAPRTRVDFLRMTK